MASSTPDYPDPPPGGWHGPILPYVIATDAVAVASVFIPLVSLAIAFRLYAQRCSQHGLEIDDYFFISALLFILALGGMMIYTALMQGLGWLPFMLIGSTRDNFVKLLFTAQILWGTSLVLIRAGLLMFYRRLFITPSFRLATSVVLVINALWYVTFFIGMFVKYRWTSREAKVIEFPPWLVSQSVLDVAQDILTLVLPLFVVSKLNMALKRKMLVGGVFFFGIVCIAASLVRLRYFIELKQVYSDVELYTCVTYRIFIWSFIQPAVSLITACLPSYAPAFAKDRLPGKVFRSAGSLFSSHRSSDVQTSVRTAVTDSSFSIEKTVGWSVRHASSDDMLVDSYHHRATQAFEHPSTHAVHIH